MAGAEIEGIGDGFGLDYIPPRVEIKIATGIPNRGFVNASSLDEMLRIKKSVSPLMTEFIEIFHGMANELKAGTPYRRNPFTEEQHPMEEICEIFKSENYFMIADFVPDYRDKMVQFYREIRHFGKLLASNLGEESPFFIGSEEWYPVKLIQDEELFNILGMYQREPYCIIVKNGNEQRNIAALELADYIWSIGRPKAMPVEPAGEQK